MTLDDDQTLALKVAIFNTTGFVAAALVTTYIDPMLTSHVKYGARSYEYGYVSLSLALPILLCTYLLTIRYKNLFLLPLVACIPLLIAGCIAVFFVFRPEFPHVNITTWVLSYCLITIITIWIRQAKDDLTFLGDTDVAVAARIEAIKSRISTWQTFTIALSAAYIAVLGVWLDRIWKNNEVIVLAGKDRFMMASTLVIEILIFSAYVVVGPIKETFSKALNLPNRFAEVIESPKTNTPNT